MNEQSNDIKKGIRVIWRVVFLLVWCFLFWRCRFGFGDADESFYLTIPYRMYRGDLLFLHEWHLSQTSSMLLYPIMWLYLKLFKGTTGIVLHFRWIFTAIWGGAALYVENRLRPYSEIGSKLSALMFLLFTSNGIMSLNYNTLGILLMMCACVTCVTAVTGRKIQYFFSGLMFAGAVLCCPYLLIFYLGFTIICWVSLLLGNKELGSCWTFGSAGALTALIVFCIYMLSKASFADYAKVFPFLLQDPQHETVSVFRKTWLLFSGAYLSSTFFLPCMGLAVMVTLLAVFTKKYRGGFVLICVISGALLVSYYFEERAMLNQLMFPLSIVGLYCTIVSNNQNSRKLFWGLWVPGFVYGFCINLSSNQYFFAFSSVSVLMSAASIIIAWRYIAEEYNNQKSLPQRRVSGIALVFSALMAIQILSELSFRYEKVYWDGGGIQNQTVCAEEGPDRGILLNSRRHENYQESVEMVRHLCSYPDVQKVVFLSIDCGLYLMAQKDFATYSAWLYYPDGLNTYYDLFPEKKPDAVYASGDFYLQFLPNFLSKGFVVDYYDEEAEIAILVRNDAIAAN